MSDKDTRLIAHYANKLLAIYEAQNNILDKYLGEDEGQDHKIGSWSCSASPIGVCIYHRFNDPASDQCIICGKPHERK